MKTSSSANLIGPIQKNIILIIRSVAFPQWEVCQAARVINMDITTKTGMVTLILLLLIILRKVKISQQAGLTFRDFSLSIEIVASKKFSLLVGKHSWR